ncbi:mitochondrial carrier homolog 2-like [Centruroides sculpturatus]|uniref:mitochondrial carrier homolog 2-like n=1 Tax=Centruroides sculpturatus TaxID=218467 RepID=UPI000C6CCC9E|nr:mitochondrial carrier homolog 2-like [Centruroides sculpturatus]
MSEGRRNNFRKTEFHELVGRITITVVGYPLELVKLLIQIGHEPIPPKPTRTFLGKPALALPGAFQYMKHIKKTDGFFGLYRGLSAKLCSNFIAGAVYTTVIEQLPVTKQDRHSNSSENDSNEQNVSAFLLETAEDTVARCISIVASHPFHALTLKSSNYRRTDLYVAVYNFTLFILLINMNLHFRTIHGSFIEIYKEEGIKGFFVGLIPRIIGEIFTIWIAHTVSFILSSYITESKQSINSYIKASVSFIASSLMYPFNVVGNVLAVNNCGLAAGVPPNMPIYANWTDCWSHLSAIGQLKRGSSILWRYYQGPYMLDRNGNPAFLRGSGPVRPAAD